MKQQACSSLGNQTRTEQWCAYPQTSCCWEILKYIIVCYIEHHIVSLGVDKRFAGQTIFTDNSSCYRGVIVKIFHSSRNYSFLSSRNCSLIHLILTLLMLRLHSSMHKKAKICENHLYPVMLVFIGKHSLSTLRWIPICQGFSQFSGFCIILYWQK